jgi:hypothetical protein
MLQTVWVDKHGFIADPVHNKQAEPIYGSALFCSPKLKILPDLLLPVCCCISESRWCTGCSHGLRTQLLFILEFDPNLYFEITVPPPRPVLVRIFELFSERPISILKVSMYIALFLHLCSKTCILLYLSSNHPILVCLHPFYSSHP